MASLKIGDKDEPAHQIRRKVFNTSGEVRWLTMLATIVGTTAISVTLNRSTRLVKISASNLRMTYVGSPLWNAEFWTNDAPKE